MKVSEQFLRDFGDAQKLAFAAGNDGGGWFFWNFRVERGAVIGDLGSKDSPMGAITRVCLRNLVGQ